MRSRIHRTLAVLLTLAMAGATEVAQAWQTATPTQQQSTKPADQQTDPAQQQNAKPADQQSAPAAQQQSQTPAQTPDNSATPTKENNASDPTHVPAPAEVLPNAPSTEQETQKIPAASATTKPQTKDQQPLGTAAAPSGTTTGGAASKPAGIAVAGKKQNQSRGLLIKVGAALAAGAALGTVYALSRGTSPVPPGAVR
jgi:cytoskeletal protein RodZ